MPSIEINGASGSYTEPYFSLECSVLSICATKVV